MHTHDAESDLFIRTPDAWLVIADHASQGKRGTTEDIGAAGSVIGLELASVKADSEGRRLHREDLHAPRPHDRPSSNPSSSRFEGRQERTYRRQREVHFPVRSWVRRPWESERTWTNRQEPTRQDGLQDACSRSTPSRKQSTHWSCRRACARRPFATSNTRYHPETQSLDAATGGQPGACTPCPGRPRGGARASPNRQRCCPPQADAGWTSNTARCLQRPRDTETQSTFGLDGWSLGCCCLRHAPRHDGVMVHTLHPTEQKMCLCCFQFRFAVEVFCFTV